MADDIELLKSLNPNSSNYYAALNKALLIQHQEGNSHDRSREIY